MLDEWRGVTGAERDCLSGAKNDVISRLWRGAEERLLARHKGEASPDGEDDDDEEEGDAPVLERREGIDRDRWKNADEDGTADNEDDRDEDEEDEEEEEDRDE